MDELSSVQKKVVQQISHWIYDEEACVTLERIAENFQLSLEEAATLLHSVPKENRKYRLSSLQVTKDIPEGDVDVVPISVFEVVTQDFSDASAVDPTRIFAMAAESCTESLHTAQEKDRVRFQDKMKELQAPVMNNINSFPSLILPSPQIEQELSNQTTAKATTFTNHQPTPSLTTSTMPAFKKKSVTSARTFFNKKETKKSAKPIEKTVTKSLTLNTKPQSSNNTKLAVPSKVGTTNSVAAQEKENHQNTRIGNADDFCGDIEESDDEEEVVVSKKPKKQHAPKEDKTVAAVPLEKPATKGAMDAFAKSVNNAPSTSTRRRRKRLVEKNYIGENGYMITETQEVWEDIPSDEEQEQLPTRAGKRKESPKKKTNRVKQPLKQGKLMGFFKKK